LNNLAWVLATSPVDQLRDGKRAIELATKACKLTDYKKPHILSTLAAAYAETGDFETAKKWSQKAVELGEGEEKEALEKELESYRAGKPVRELMNEDKSDQTQKPEAQKPEATAKKTENSGDRKSPAEKPRAGKSKRKPKAERKTTPETPPEAKTPSGESSR
jgi:hypothetical protein